MIVSDTNETIDALRFIPIFQVIGDALSLRTRINMPLSLPEGAEAQARWEGGVAFVMVRASSTQPVENHPTPGSVDDLV